MAFDPIQECEEVEVMSIQEGSSTVESNVDGKIVSAKWYNNKDESIEAALVNAEVKIELITENISDESQIEVQIKEKDADVLKTLNTTVKENKIKYDKIKLEKEWEDKVLLITVQNNVSQPFDGTESLTVEAQFCDPLDTMKIRKNRASNLYGKVRTKDSVANSKNHQGFDYYAVSGTDIKAVSDGVVKKIVNPSSGDYGIQLVIKIDNSTYYAFYAHLSEIGSGISTDSEVKKGDTIGKTGATGNASSLTGDDLHLHFECRTEVSPGLGLVGRESPNKIVETKFYTQNDAVNANGEYTSNQTNSGVKKVESDGTETLMSVE